MCHERAQPPQNPEGSLTVDWYAPTGTRRKTLPCIVARCHASGYTDRWSSAWRDALQNSMRKGGLAAWIGWMTTSNRDKQRQAKESTSDTYTAAFGRHRPAE